MKPNPLFWTLLVVAFGSACGGKKGGGSKASPEPQTQGPASRALGAVEDVSLKELLRGKELALRSDFASTFAYRFELNGKGDLRTSLLSKELRCNGDAALTLEIVRLDAGGTRVIEAVSSVSSASTVTLASGTYAFLFAKSPDVTCTQLNVTFRSQLALHGEPGQPSSRPEGSPPSSPQNPEANRILLRHLKSETAIEFLAKPW